MKDNMTKLTFTVEKGPTSCNNCPFGYYDCGEFTCCGIDLSLDCDKYDLSTFSLINEEE